MKMHLHGTGVEAREHGDAGEPSQRTERRSFSLHHSLIRTLILDQAIGLEAALRELVMNAIDAGATAIHITLDRDGFEIRDDGRGMGSRDDVLRNFECFGQPQEDLLKTFGRYRLGRAQILGYAATTWRSGTLQMNVNFLGGASGAEHEKPGPARDGYFTRPNLPSDAQFEYDLIEDMPNTKGTIVAGKFHQALPQWELEHLTSAGLSVRYVSIPVYINDRKVSTPPQECTWTFEDDTAWYLIDDVTRPQHESLKIYNQGVFVTNASSSVAGCAGIVVTKKSLSLTLGRNDVKGNCWVWHQVQTALAHHLNGLLHLRDPKQLPTRSEAIRVIRLLSGLDPIDPDLHRALARSTRNTKILQGLNDKRHSPDDLLDRAVTFYDGVHALVAETADARGTYTVLRTDELMEASRQWGNVREQTDVEQVAADLIQAIYEALPWPERRPPTIIPFSRVVESLHDLGDEIDESTLGEAAKVGLEVMRRAAKLWAGRVRRPPRYRTIHPGRSDTLLGWTDGLSTIHLRETLLAAVCNGFGGLSKALMVLAHELAHDAPSRGQTTHDAAFYNRFHDIVHSRLFQEVAYRAQADLLRLLGQRKLQVRTDLGAQIDAITTLGATLKRKRRKGKLAGVDDLMRS